ncbi:MAG: hypothetical protein GXZ04_06045 [Clostridiales bacterium]|nr:hypothetical protein [Clostridiales bacterium]
MQFMIGNWLSILIGIALILLLTLVTRGNLRGSKKSPVKGCDNCTCGGGTCTQQETHTEHTGN